MSAPTDVETRLAVAQVYLRRHRRGLLHRAQGWGFLTALLLLAGFLFNEGGVAALGAFLFGGACVSVVASAVESINYVRFTRFYRYQRLILRGRHAFTPSHRP